MFGPDSDPVIGVSGLNTEGAEKLAVIGRGKHSGEIGRRRRR